MAGPDERQDTLSKPGQPCAALGAENLGLPQGLGDTQVVVMAVPVKGQQIMFLHCAAHVGVPQSRSFTICFIMIYYIITLLVSMESRERRWREVWCGMGKFMGRRKGRGPTWFLRLAMVLGCLISAVAPCFAEDPASPKVVVSIKPIHGLIASVMRGVGEPRLLLSGIASPHSYSLRPSQAAAL